MRALLVARAHFTESRPAPSSVVVATSAQLLLPRRRPRQLPRRRLSVAPPTHTPHGNHSRQPPSTSRRLTVTMVEGHQCHRVAAHHRKILQGLSFRATSPNGRFVEGAKAIDGKPLDKIEVVGKNLFYFFGGTGQDTTVLHFHFGMSGAFKTFDLPGREPTPTTRLQLVCQEAKLMAHLSAMTVQHGGIELYEEKYASLGPDPLREDADKERFWQRAIKTKKPIGLLLMDQSCVAGVGNIYRAEILFQARLHPEQPANTVSRDKFDEVWQFCVTDLQRGFKSGSILTVTASDAKRLGPPWTRRYIYNHKMCGECGTPVSSWDMASRTVYACESCQPLQEGSVLDVSRSKALSAASPTVVFKSHCAPEGPETETAAKLTVAELRERLTALGLSPVGRKAELVERLDEHIKDTTVKGKQLSPALRRNQRAAVVSKDEPAVVVKAEDEGDEAKVGLAKLKVTELRALLKKSGLPVDGKKEELIARLQAQARVIVEPEQVQPGTAILGDMATAEEAAQEKERAGENRAVEHVALFDQRPAATKSSKRNPAQPPSTIKASFRSKKPRRGLGSYK